MKLHLTIAFGSALSVAGCTGEPTRNDGAPSESVVNDAQAQAPPSTDTYEGRTAVTSGDRDAGNISLPADAGAAPSQLASWDLASSGEGDGLRFAEAAERPLITIFCPANRNILLINIPSFRPIGSEDRLSIGSRAEQAVLVADVGGDGSRGGLSADGPVPATLQTILTSGISVSYGDQVLGPLKAVPGDMARTFIAGCKD